MGEKDKPKEKLCPVCKGKGDIQLLNAANVHRPWSIHTCYECKGKGTISYTN